MAAMTPRTIRERLQTLLEDGDPSLLRSIEPFSLTKQPNTVTDKAYTLEDERVRETSLTAEVTARIDRVTLSVARRLGDPAEDTVVELLDLLDDIDRRVRADGVSQGYHMQPQGSRVLRPDGRDYCVGVLSWLCDYDYSETVN